MVDDKISMRTQSTDARLNKRMDSSIRLLEDELDSKLAEKIKSNDAKVTSKSNELGSKFLM